MKNVDKLLKYDNNNTTKLLIDNVSIKKECVIINRLTVDNGLPWITIFGQPWGDWTMLSTNHLEMWKSLTNGLSEQNSLKYVILYFTHYCMFWTDKKVIKTHMDLPFCHRCQGHSIWTEVVLGPQDLHRKTCVIYVPLDTVYKLVPERTNTVNYSYTGTCSWPGSSPGHEQAWGLCICVVSYFPNQSLTSVLNAFRSN